jgi:hypothetical protein
MITIIDELKLFLEESRDRVNNRKWISEKDIKVYIRKTPRIFVNERLVCLDIGSVEVRIPSKGIFTNFLYETHKLNPWNVTYVENVSSERFANFFRTRGYKEGHIGRDPTPCFYRIKHYRSMY